jgi:hypothetical protein
VQLHHNFQNKNIETYALVASELVTGKTKHHGPMYKRWVSYNSTMISKTKTCGPRHWWQVSLSPPKPNT